jgi:hypothetical protein
MNEIRYVVNTKDFVLFKWKKTHWDGIFLKYYW